MDFRCPACRKDLARRKLVQAIITRMDTDCAFCKRALRLNVHRSEEVLVMVSFGTLAVLAAMAYWFRSEALALAAMGAAMLGAAAAPLLERTYLRSWPRYLPREQEQPGAAQE